jgi:hypothetical protein
MVLGYCMICDKLVPLRRGPQKWGSRERAWFPIDHAGRRAPGTGYARCSGIEVEIKNRPEPPPSLDG